MDDKEGLNISSRRVSINADGAETESRNHKAAERQIISLLGAQSNQEQCTASNKLRGMQIDQASSIESLYCLYMLAKKN